MMVWRFNYATENCTTLAPKADDATDTQYTRFSNQFPQ